MTEPSDNQTGPISPPASTPKAAPRKTVRPRVIAASVLTLMLASAAGGAVMFQQSDFLRAWFPPANDTHLTQILDRSEDRVRILEHGPASTPMTAPDAVPPSPALPNKETLQKINDLTGRIDNLQNQVEALQAQHGQDLQNINQTIITTLALRDLRDAVMRGQSYTSPLNLTLKNLDPHLRQDPNIAAALKILADHSTGVTSLADLRQELIAHEPDLSLSTNPALPAWAQQLQKSIHRLISIHPAHDIGLEVLEQALAQNNVTGATTAFDALPEAARANLALWHDKLLAHLQAIDAVGVLSNQSMLDMGAP